MGIAKKHLEMSTTTTTTRSNIKVLILIFFKVISSRELVPNFNEDEIVLALNEDNTGLQHYAMGFWKPLPKERPFQKRFYLIQVRKQVVNVPSFIVRLDSQKHIDFSLKSPFGGGRPGRVKRKNAKKGSGGDDDEE